MSMTDQTIIRYDLNAGNAARGIALLLLLWHHLFFSKCDICSIPVCISSKFAQVCVAIFVILSGYGLAVSVGDRPMGLLAFFKKRLPRLYLNYWLIALIFIPIGILFEYRPLIMAFPTQPYLKLLIQMTGFHMFIDSVQTRSALTIVTPTSLHSEVSLIDSDYWLKCVYKKGKTISDFALKEKL